jgi:phosphomannomutase/phosphoglucomutase
LRREIFREYDIRGIAGTDLTADSVELLGLGIGTLMRREGKSQITLGRDCRPSSDPFRDALAAGLTAAGISVIDLGIVPTPLLYYSIYKLKTDGGVMITGSHNPPEYNGFKTCVGTETIHGRRIQEIYTIIEARDFSRGAGSIAKTDIVPSYLENGTACLMAPSLIRSLGCEVTELFCDMDGTFPNHHPDPTLPANLKDLQSVVTSRGLDVGMAFDGDADRIGVVDDRGEIVWGDKLMIVYAWDILTRHPGATFISEVKCSMNLFREIEKKGGRAIMWKTGHSLIKAKMKEEHALLAGEMSGHMFFADRYFGYDDAIYAACRLVEILSHSGETLSRILSEIPATVVTPEIRVQCDDDKKFAVVEKVKAYFEAKHEVIDVDGARILFPEGWGLVRASNTQDVLVLRFEAGSQKALESIRSRVEEEVDRAKASL